MSNKKTCAMNNAETNTISERELINMINQKNDNVFDLLYEKYWPALLNFAATYVTDKDTCKEIVQELFITLHAKRSQLFISTSLSSYLYSSLRNRILNHFRDESVYKKHITGASRRLVSVKAYNNVEQFINLAELKKQIFNCLNTMPIKYKEVYVLYMQNEYTLTKIAEILDRPLATVEKQFRKATYQVRGYLIEHEAA
jgi:RNA polymerase sigma factor (sigma-70 family)